MQEYSKKALDNAYKSLNSRQKEVLDEYIKRGKKTKWLNYWAEKKGITLTKDDLSHPEKAIENLLDWQLVDYEDALKTSPELKCECGRSLRYRYTVLHKKTGQIYKLGIVHFRQHTGLDPETVRKIKKGLETIDLERDEILGKVLGGWQLPFKIPKDLDIPKDIVLQLEVKLPLLDRQIKRLQNLIIEKNESIRQRPGKLSGHHYSMNKTKHDAQEVSISGVEPVELLMKLKQKTINAKEVEQLYLFAKHNKSGLIDYGIELSILKQESKKALGKISNRFIRKWLVEIDYL